MFEEQILLLHLKGEGEPSGPDRWPDVARRFGWSRGRWERVVRNLLREGLVKRQGSELLLTPEGRQQLEETGTTLLAHRDG